MMKLLLALSRAIDTLNEHVGRLTYWLILAAVLISAGNAVVRYSFNMSSQRLAGDPVVPVLLRVPLLRRLYPAA